MVLARQRWQPADAAVSAPPYGRGDCRCLSLMGRAGAGGPVIFRRHCLRSRSMLIAALVGLTLVGCTGTTSRRPAPSASIPAAERPSNVRTPDTGVLRCGDSVTGGLGSDWQRNAVTA